MMPHLPGLRALLIGSLIVVVTSASAVELTDAEVIKILTTEQPKDRAIRRGLEFIRSEQKPSGSVGLSLIHI